MAIRGGKQGRPHIAIQAKYDVFKKYSLRYTEIIIKSGQRDAFVDRCYTEQYVEVGFSRRHRKISC